MTILAPYHARDVRTLSALLQDEAGRSRWIIPAVVIGVIVLLVAVNAWRRARAKRAREAAVLEGPRPMGGGDFWGLVETAKGKAGPDPLHRPAELTRALKSEDPNDIERFQSRYLEVRQAADTQGLRAAAHLVHGGCSDVEFVHFRDWLISEGEDVYEAAVADADSLADLGHRGLYSLEAFGYAAKRAYKSVAGRSFPVRGQDVAKTTRAPEWSESEARATLPRLSGVVG